MALVGFGVDRLPFFLAREAPVELEHRVDTAAEAAGMLAACASARHRFDPAAVRSGAGVARDGRRGGRRRGSASRGLADAAGAFGKARTPFLLAALAQLTDGRSLEANLALLEDNARVAAQVANALTAVA